MYFSPPNVYIYPVIDTVTQDNVKNTADRMRLDEVVAYCSTRGYKQTATYFMGTVRNHELYDVILDRNAYWINTRSVQDYLPEEFFKDLQRKVSTWMPEA